MTNIIKRKDLLSLIAVVVMVAMMSIACKNRTNGISLSVEEASIVNPSEDLPSISTATYTVDKNKTALQYIGSEFKSQEYFINGSNGEKFRYTVKITQENDQFGTVLMTLKGYNKGNEFTTQYSMPGAIKGQGDNYVVLNYVGAGSASAIFRTDTDGKCYLDFKPLGLNLTLVMTKAPTK